MLIILNSKSNAEAAKLKPLPLLPFIHSQKKHNFSTVVLALQKMKMEEASQEDDIMEARAELMVSPSSGGNPTLRTAYFLKPCILEGSPPPDFLPPHFPMFSKTATFTSNHAKVSREVRYNGWRRPQEEWKKWVRRMQPKYEYLWIKAGIDRAIKASTYEVNRNDELVLGLAKRWCSKTNTFLFPWGEATITLEDMKVCWGYSVVGGAVSSPLVSREQKETEAELFVARRMFNSSKSKKVVHYPWMMHFKENESRVEHEAFLVYWLSRFVFPANSFNTILKSVFPIAIHLARGTRIALAPAVLASIYRDLSLLNSSINKATTTNVTLWAPCQLVQIWALERFPALKPRPRAIEQGKQPRVARWDGVKMLKNKNLELTLNSAGARNGFLWRPYENSPSLKLYNEKDMWECDNPYLDEELQSFALCLRVSELVGMGCREQYLPHRVAMQFGMDQDIPGMVARSNKGPWMSYSQLIMDMNLCIVALCSSRPSVTSRYYDWWKQSKSGKEGDTVKDYDHCLISTSSSEHVSPALCGQVEGERSCGPPPGFTSKFERDQVGASEKEDHLPVIELLSSSSEAECFDDEVAGNGEALSSPQFSAFPSSSVRDEIAGCGNEAKIKSPFCDRNGVYDIKGESPSAVDIAFNLENRIQKLEKAVAKLKAARFGPKVEIIGVKAKP